MKFQNLKNSVCVWFSRAELEALFRPAQEERIHAEMKKQGLSFQDLRKDYSKMEEIAAIVGEQGAQHRDDHEIFAALYIFFRFYPENSEIGFELKDVFNQAKDKIKTLAELNGFRKVDADSDFLIKSRDGIRKFQLKRYRGNMSAEAITAFINKKVAHYGNGLEGTNLLLTLQPAEAYTKTHIEFKEIHDKIKTLNLQNSQVLIAYNQANKKQEIIQVYPEINKVSIPAIPPSAQ